MNATKQNADVLSETILDLLAEAPVFPITLHRQLADSGRHWGARLVSTTIREMVTAGMITQDFGGGGAYRLTDSGRADVFRRQQAGVQLNIPIEHPGVSAFNSFTGEVQIGRYQTGGDASWRLWDDQGALNALVTGRTGSGTSMTLEGVVRSIEGHLAVRSWVIDPMRQLGFLKHSRVAREDYEIDTMLDDVWAVLLERNRVLAGRGRQGWQAPRSTPGMPLGVLTISTLEVVGNSNFDRFNKLADIVRLSRKVGISVLAETESMQIGSFGVASNLRDAFMNENLTRLRSVAGWSEHLMGNPNRVPFPALSDRFPDGSSTAGLGYDSRGSLLRTFHVSDE